MTNVYVTAAGFSHWHILEPAELELTRCGFKLPVSLPGRASGVSSMVDAQTKPFCEKCVSSATAPADGANVHDAEAFKAGARFERRQLAAKLRELVRYDGGGLAFQVRELANELEPREGE